MVELSRFWDPNAGDFIAISDDELMDRFFRVLLNGTGNQGVLPGWANELEVTDGGALNASVDTGGAIVYGLGYENDAAATVALPNNATVWVVVRRDWAVPQARLTQVAALVQNPTVTYDIPLAQVTTLAGVITLITDGRDYCEFSTELQEDSVATDHLQDDAVTTAKLENQTRQVTRGAGELRADQTNPATWVKNAGYEPYTDTWEFTDGVADAVWCTFRVPADISSATMEVFVWTRNQSNKTGDVVWHFDSWDAQPSAVLANQLGNATESYAYPDYEESYRTSLGTITATAGDIFHVQIYRNGAAGGDTLTNAIYLYMVEFEYTADS